ncbi:AI-2E family transporter [uncultured Thiodictyon sp.]|uniref:AI-2E family transporter n=1 Tax=uncultured Thiodictyon sp. TaxID=1846217 RepID=UPI0025ED58F9|nr:AI-2E family transporter [uncultured Thiodictyon sp.]
MHQETISKWMVLLLTLGISALFLAMIQPFLMALFLAGVGSALAQPLFLRLTTLFHGRRALASLTSLTLMTLVVLIPLALLVGVLISQAQDVGQFATVWVQETLAQPNEFIRLLHRIPFYDQLAPHWGKIAQQAGTATSAVSKVAMEGLSSFTLGTVNFVFMVFVFLYSLYFLQMDGEQLVDQCLDYLPLKTHDERALLENFMSVTRATLRGSLLIGLLQGSLAGIAFAVAGIPNAVFWGSVMVVLSTIPQVGSALIWLPATGILIMQGHTVTGLTLAAFCGLLVGSLDNVLRPILVGKDTKMHELMIFLSTLGGLFMFGFPGIFIGPVIGSLLVSIWAIYGIAFAAPLRAVDGVVDGPAESQPVCAPADPQTSGADPHQPQRISPSPLTATAGPAGRTAPP